MFCSRKLCILCVNLMPDQLWKVSLTSNPWAQIEVLWSTGVQPLPAMYPLQIKGRNLYRLHTLRQVFDSYLFFTRCMTQDIGKSSLQVGVFYAALLFPISYLPIGENLIREDLSFECWVTAVAEWRRQTSSSCGEAPSWRSCS